MSYTKLIQQYKDFEPECPKCFDDEFEVNLDNASHGLIVRKCPRGHEWLDDLTIKEWRFMKRKEAAVKKGNINQHKKASPSVADQIEQNKSFQY